MFEKLMYLKRLSLKDQNIFGCIKFEGFTLFLSITVCDEQLVTRLMCYT